MKLVIAAFVTSLLLVPTASYAVDAGGCQMVAGKRVCPPPHVGGDYDDKNSDNPEE